MSNIFLILYNQGPAAVEASVILGQLAGKEVSLLPVMAKATPSASPIRRGFQRQELTPGSFAGAAFGGAVQGVEGLVHALTSPIQTVATSLEFAKDCGLSLVDHSFRLVQIESPKCAQQATERVVEIGKTLVETWNEASSVERVEMGARIATQALIIRKVGSCARQVQAPAKKPPTPKLLEAKEVASEWTQGTNISLKKGAYALVEEGSERYLSLHVDGLFARGEKGVLLHMMRKVARLVEEKGVQRAYLVTEFRNLQLEQVLAKRYGLSMVEKVGASKVLYSIDIKHFIKVVT